MVGLCIWGRIAPVVRWGRTLRRATYTPIAFGLVVVSLPLWAAPISIDEFTEPTTAVQHTSNAGAQVQWSDTGLTATLTVGGVRDGSIGCEYYDNISVIRATVGAGSLSVDSTGSSTPSLYLSYDATSGWPGSPAAPEG